jgi:hypothetical protein
VAYEQPSKKTREAKWEKIEHGGRFRFNPERVEQVSSVTRDIPTIATISSKRIYQVDLRGKKSGNQNQAYTQDDRNAVRST